MNTVTYVCTSGYSDKQAVYCFCSYIYQTLLKQSVAMPNYVPLRSGPCRVWDDESKQKATATAEQGGEKHLSCCKAVWYITFHTSWSHIWIAQARLWWLGLSLEEELVSFLLKITEVLCTNFCLQMTTYSRHWNLATLSVGTICFEDRFCTNGKGGIQGGG